MTVPAVSTTLLILPLRTNHPDTQLDVQDQQGDGTITHSSRTFMREALQVKITPMM